VTLGMLYCSSARAQIAPGPVSRAHADLGGITQCASCHDFGARALKCLECHAEIKRRIETKTGFHARAYKSSPGETDCARCHAEHRGSKFAFVPLDRAKFDHSAQTGFTLEGKHRAQKCENCHNATKVSAGARSEIKVKDPNRSFLGLHRECSACHKEPHLNKLSADCLGCHTMEAWKPASKFNHARAAFQLTGLHQQVACTKCHAQPQSADVSEARDSSAPEQGTPAQKALLFKGLSFSGCPSCHTDPHHGAFQEVKPGSKCEGCHNTGGWKSNRPSSSFNHTLTKFRLTGKHDDLSCGKCHKDSDFSRTLAHELCQNCHQDPHKGQFAARAAGADCSSCHSTTNFKPTLFDREGHMRSAFPLVEKHASLRCVECHQPEGREARYKTGKLLCPSCHTERADPHGGEFAAQPYANKCDLCHTQAGFEATTFSLERHAQTQFQLAGRHAEVECHKCHKPLAPTAAEATPEVPKKSSAPLPPAGAGKSAARDARRQYHFASRACEVCHADPHGIDPQTKMSCTTCHDVQGWKAVLLFDHSRTPFKLSGSHQDPAHPIGCVKCHKPSGQTDGAASGTAPGFAKTPNQCSGCHIEKDAHGGQFINSVSLVEDCFYCHTPAAWKIGDFDHDKTRFALNRAHNQVDCAKCHKDQNEVNGKMVRMYRDTPRDCLKCH
jgi:hypothetical protein